MPLSVGRAALFVGTASTWNSAWHRWLLSAHCTDDQMSEEMTKRLHGIPTHASWLREGGRALETRVVCDCSVPAYKMVPVIDWRQVCVCMCVCVCVCVCVCCVCVCVGGVCCNLGGGCYGGPTVAEGVRTSIQAWPSSSHLLLGHAHHPWPRPPPLSHAHQPAQAGSPADRSSHWKSCVGCWSPGTALSSPWALPTLCQGM